MNKTNSTEGLPCIMTEQAYKEALKLIKLMSKEERWKLIKESLGMWRDKPSIPIDGGATS